MRIQQNTNRINAFVKVGLAILVVLIALSLTGFADNPKDYELKTDTYIVQKGDTLWNIADTYMQKNSYGTRDIREFKTGIQQLNYDRYPEIKSGLIHPNDELQISYWIRKD
ncbi:MAG: Peptidoglycan-binding lysin protein [Bacillales bacterium]|jgi:hypothetical protein|nr:Peptidoglycan-binding lysin protein [Bacillales bacterium]